MRAAPALLAVVAALFACAPKTVPAPPAGAKVVVVPAGAPRPATRLPVVFAEVSETQEKRSRGLGGRERLAPDEGMLFVYPEDAVRTYWMKDCRISLDIAFIDRARRIVGAATLPPGAGRTDADVPRAGSRLPARYVLETEAGWLLRHGVGVGDEVDLSAALAGVAPR